VKKNNFYGKILLEKKEGIVWQTGKKAYRN
jgi:hypothetical protein